ncbi:MAG: aldo/keto reductase [Actinomycetaceae bacterium]|nr:aldo/keto reductase [Actinomycetaceae bacterium]
MKRTNCGNSGLVVGKLGLGTLTWGRDTELDDARRMVRSLLDHGGNVVDISPMYGDGLAQSVLGEVLATTVNREDLVIVAHAGLHIADSKIVRDCSRSALIRSLDDTLSQLNSTYVDVLHIAAPDPRVPFVETVETLAHFVSQGKVRYIGLANHQAWQVARTAQYLRDRHLPALNAVSVDYSLLDRNTEEELMPATREFGIGIFAQAPLASGVLTGKYRHTIPPTSRAATDHLSATVERYLDSQSRGQVEAVAKAADGLGRTPADIALTWLMDQPEVATVLCGARTAAQFDQIVNLDYSPLPIPVTEALNDVTA